MIKHTKHSAHFQISGATLAGEYQPQTGITAVVGPNGSGKTFAMLEVPRWLLFGKSALRGLAGDYKEASATGVFTIRGADYEISRGKNEWIKSADGVTQAVGAEKVTEKVVELLGYGLDVFDICNASLQGKTQSLGDLRPAERKQMIDRVLRLTSTEAIEKLCRDEAKALQRDAETLTKALRAPGDRPAPPADYLPSASSRARLADAKKVRDAADKLQPRLAVMVEPDRPDGARPTREAIAALQEHEDRRRADEQARAALAAIAGRSTSDWTREGLATAADRYEWEKLRDARGPEPTENYKEVFEMQKVWARIDAIKSMADVETCCPKCDHKFRTRPELPAEPRLTKREIGEELTRHDLWLTPLPPEPEGSPLAPDKVAKHLETLDAKDKLTAWASYVDCSEELGDLRRLESQHQFYEEQLTKWRASRDAAVEAEKELAALGSVPTLEEIYRLHDEFTAASSFETETDRWEADVTAHRKATEEIGEKLRLAEEFKLGAKDLSEARAMVKALIAPRISRIASVLINDMTLGKLRTVTLDEDMEITVDGQRLNTLSGAGKTVANLALRVAMGQALVAKTFPVFLADEIDGDLEPARREATLMALVGLKKHLQQIILVTHRDVDVADHVISTV